MTDALFNRDFSVTIETVKISARPLLDQVGQLGQTATTKPTLRVQFKIESSADHSPNKADVAIYNLSKSSRAEIQKKNARVIIEAGYVGNISQIFSGELMFANHVRQGTDWVSHFQSGDGVRQYQQARVNESFAPGTAVDKVLESVAKSMGVGLGNALDKIKEGNFRGGITEFTKGIVTSGKSADVLDELMRTTGLEWSIQDGQLQVLKEGEAADEPKDAVLLDAAHGLIGSPELGEEGKSGFETFKPGEDKTGTPYVKARSLLQGTLKPGRLVKIVSRQMDGFFNVRKVTHGGDTWAGDWYSDIEARAA